MYQVRHQQKQRLKQLQKSYRHSISKKEPIIIHYQDADPLIKGFVDESNVNFEHNKDNNFYEAQLSLRSFGELTNFKLKKKANSIVPNLDNYYSNNIDNNLLQQHSPSQLQKIGSENCLDRPANTQSDILASSPTKNPEELLSHIQNNPDLVNQQSNNNEEENNQSFEQLQQQECVNQNNNVEDINQQNNEIQLFEEKPKRSKKQQHNNDNSPNPPQLSKLDTNDSYENNQTYPTETDRMDQQQNNYINEQNQLQQDVEEEEQEFNNEQEPSNTQNNTINTTNLNNEESFSKLPDLKKLKSNTQDGELIDYEQAYQTIEKPKQSSRQVSTNRSDKLKNSLTPSTGYQSNSGKSCCTRSPKFRRVNGFYDKEQIPEEEQQQQNDNNQIQDQLNNISEQLHHHNKQISVLEQPNYENQDSEDQTPVERVKRAARRRAESQEPQNITQDTLGNNMTADMSKEQLNPNEQSSNLYYPLISSQDQSSQEKIAPIDRKMLKGYYDLLNLEMSNNTTALNDTNEQQQEQQQADKDILIENQDQFQQPQTTEVVKEVDEDDEENDEDVDFDDIYNQIQNQITNLKEESQNITQSNIENEQQLGQLPPHLGSPQESQQYQEWFENQLKNRQNRQSNSSDNCRNQNSLAYDLNKDLNWKSKNDPFTYNNPSKQQELMYQKAFQEYQKQQRQQGKSFNGSTYSTLDEVEQQQFRKWYLDHIHSLTTEQLIKYYKYVNSNCHNNYIRYLNKKKQ